MTNININAGGYVFNSPSAFPKPVPAVAVAAPVSLGNAFNPKRCGTKTSHVIFVLDDKFDGRNVNSVYNRLPVATVSPLNRDTYNPNGMTNLFDAIGGVMMQINADLTAKKKADRDSIIINILTDGH